MSVWAVAEAVIRSSSRAVQSPAKEGSPLMREAGRLHTKPGGVSISHKVEAQRIGN